MGEKEFARELEGRRDRVKASCANWVGYGCQDLEDLIQEVMIAAWEKKETIRPEEIEGYLVRIARNVCVQYLRNRKEETELKEDYRANLSDPVEKMALEQAINKLPEPFKRIIKLKSEGWEIVEIASIERVTPSAISQRMSRAKKLLKELLDA